MIGKIRREHPSVCVSMWIWYLCECVCVCGCGLISRRQNEIIGKIRRESPPVSMRMLVWYRVCVDGLIRLDLLVFE